MVFVKGGNPDRSRAGANRDLPTALPSTGPELRIAGARAGLGGFGSVEVPAQDSIDASVGAPLRFAAGSGITLTTVPATSTLTISASGGGGGGNSYFPSGWA